MHVHHNVLFVVNLESLDEAIDVRADGNGVWKKGSPSGFCKCSQAWKFYRQHL